MHNLSNVQIIFKDRHIFFSVCMKTKLLMTQSYIFRLGRSSDVYFADSGMLLRKNFKKILKEFLSENINHDILVLLFFYILFTLSSFTNLNKKLHISLLKPANFVPS